MKRVITTVACSLALAGVTMLVGFAFPIAPAGAGTPVPAICEDNICSPTLPSIMVQKVSVGLESSVGGYECTMQVVGSVSWADDNGDAVGSASGTAAVDCDTPMDGLSAQSYIIDNNGSDIYGSPGACGSFDSGSTCTAGKVVTSSSSELSSYMNGLWTFGGNFQLYFPLPIANVLVLTPTGGTGNGDCVAENAWVDECSLKTSPLAVS